MGRPAGRLNKTTAELKKEAEIAILKAKLKDKEKERKRLAETRKKPLEKK